MPLSNFQIAGHLKDAVHQARDIHKTNLPTLWKGQKEGIDVEKEFLDYVVKRGSVGKSSGYEVRILMVASELSETHGALVRKKYTDDKEINFILIPRSTQRNYCWRRFTKCKELCHLLIDTKSSLWCTDVMRQLESAASRPLFEGNLEDGDKSLSSEQFCYFLALELAVPWKVRLEHPELQTVKDKDYRAYAEVFRIPEAVVESADRSGYLDASLAVNRGLDANLNGVLLSEPGEIIPLLGKTPLKK